MQLKRAAIVLAVLLSALPAEARQQQQAGFFVAGGYAYATSADHLGMSVEGAAIGGQLPVYQSGLHVQLDAAYNSYSGHDFTPTIHTWNFGVDPYFQWSSGRAGGTLHYVGQNGGYGYTDDTVYSYGVFGEWFAGSRLTLGGKVNLASAEAHTDSNAGVRLAAYFIPDFALSAMVEHTGAKNESETDLTLEGEYLFSESFPVSLYAGYDHARATGADVVNIFFIGLKIYANGHNERTLVDRQRSGTLGWLASYGTSNF